MYAKVINGQVVAFPYTVNQLRDENPQISFPVTTPADTLLEFGVVPVVSTGVAYDPATQIATQEGCIYNEAKQRWETAWTVRPMTEQELQELAQQKDQQRKLAYQNEADPLFFKWQRGESTQEVWLAKVAEIKARYPAPTQT